jgi:hypothetical protein
MKLRRLAPTTQNTKIPMLPAQHHVFMTIATGQAVSNLPPILEYGRPGDAVLWVESPEAQQRQWIFGPSQVLKQAGLHILSPHLTVNDINNPFELQHKTQARIPQLQNWRPVIVTNGGPKLSPIGLLKAWEAQRPVILYGNVPTVTLRIFPNGLEAPPEDRPYQHHQLDLLQILHSSGHEPFHLDQYPPTRLWPTTTLLPLMTYGEDPDYTRQVHHEHDQFAACGQASAANFELPTFHEISHLRQQGLLTQKELDKWIDGLVNFFGRIKNGSKLNSPKQFITSNFRITELLYGTTKNLIEHANSLKTRLAHKISPPTTHLGTLFEQAVARRLLIWLKQWPYTTQVIQSVWSNIRIAHSRSPDIQTAEWDIVLVLRNGLLLCIECKSFDAEQKDLDARLLNIQRAGSNLADMIVCAPLYTAFSNKSWFSTMHNLKIRVGNSRYLSFLPFTLPNQSAEYVVPGSNPVRYESCVTFEDTLAQRLARYVD